MMLMLLACDSKVDVLKLELHMVDGSTIVREFYVGEADVPKVITNDGSYVLLITPTTGGSDCAEQFPGVLYFNTLSRTRITPQDK